MKRISEPLRILVVDDDPAILLTYKYIFSPKQKDSSGSEIFDVESIWGNTGQDVMSCELVTCRQGDEAVDIVKRSLAEDRPFAMAFIDVRMPPGPDGVWAARQIRGLDPHIEFVIVTVYSDVDPREIAAQVLPVHKLLFLQKPFHPLEIYQFVSALGSKWCMELEIQRSQERLEIQVKERTAELVEANEQLSREIKERRQIGDALRDREKELEKKNVELSEINSALNVLLKKLQEEKKEVEERVFVNVKELIQPYLTRLQNSRLNHQQSTCLNILESHLNNIISPFINNLNAKYKEFTPKEIQVASLIREGKTTKEIAELLYSSQRAIEFHRNSLRDKLGIKKKKANLRSYLLSLS